MSWKSPGILTFCKNVLEMSWNFFKIHQNASFLYIKLQIFLGGDTPEPPSGCWDPNLAPVNLFGIVNCYYIVNSTANRRGNDVFELSCMQKSWKMSWKMSRHVLEKSWKCPGISKSKLCGNPAHSGSISNDHCDYSIWSNNSIYLSQ